MIALVAINFSQAATVDSTKASKSADTTMLNVGKSALNSITTAAGTGYDVIVQQQRVYAVQYLLVGLLSIICVYFFVSFYKKATGPEKIANTLFPAIVFGIVALWTAIVFSFHYSQIVQGLVNPDFAAIKDIIAMFKDIKK